MNEYDSSRIQDLMQLRHKFENTNNPEEADLILLNTCSIREKAQEKVFHELGRWKKLKENNPNLKIGICGERGGDGGVQFIAARATRKHPGRVVILFGRLRVKRF